MNDSRLPGPKETRDSDGKLLRRYAETGSRAAFDTLVERHLPFVSSVCLRGLGNRQLAEDAAQVVFMVLARRASSLSQRVFLPGWLFQTARLTARDMRKREARRAHYERQAMQETMSEHSQLAASWQDVEPIIDDMIARLKTEDRNVLLLRFYEERDFAEIAQDLEISEEAARMRVSRALGKVRGWLAREGVGVTSATLLNWISNVGIQHTSIAPMEMAARVFNPTIGSDTLLISKGILKTMWMFNTKAIVATTLVTAIVVTGGVTTAVKFASVGPGEGARTVAMAPGPGAHTIAASSSLSPQKGAVTSVLGARKVTTRLGFGARKDSVKSYSAVALSRAKIQVKAHTPATITAKAHAFTVAAAQTPPDQPNSNTPAKPIPPVEASAAQSNIDAGNLLANPGFDTLTGEAEKAWVHSTVPPGSNIDGVTYIWDSNTAHSGTASLCLRKISKGYFPISQLSQTIPYTGNATSVKVSAWVKTNNLTKATLDVQFLNWDGAHPENGAFSSHHWIAYLGARNAGDPPVTQDWTLYTATVPIPAGTRQIAIAPQIYGPGTVWFDDLRAEYVP